MSKNVTAASPVADFVVSRIGLHELHVDPLNVRKVDAKEDPVLTASIEAHGLQTPLIVRKNAKGYGVVAGGKRLLSLQKLYPDQLACLVPCIIIDHKTPDVAVIEASLAENVARSEMHPVDQYRTFTALAAQGMTEEAIGKRFSIEPRRVRQLLALGNLDAAVLEAYAADQIGADVVRAFTMIASTKTQKAILGQIKAGKIHANAWNVRQAAGIKGEQSGKLLALVTREAYEARGGKINEDLFGTDHVLSDYPLVVTMANELVAAKAAELTAEGWGTVITEEPGDWWRYNRVSPKFEPTKPEQKELDRLKKLIEENEEAEDFDQARDDEAEAASEAYDALEAAINARGMTPALKAKAIVCVSVNHKGNALELDVRNPPREEPKAQKAAAEKAEAKKKLPVEDTISQALNSRLSENLTDAVAEVVAGDRDVALAGLIAALTSRSSETVRIRFDNNEYNAKAPSFAVALRDAMKLSAAEQVQTLVCLIAKAVSLRSWNGSALDQANHKALAEAVDGTRLTKAVRGEFDAGSFFDSVSKAVIVEAVREAMGKDHADNVAKMDKTAASKFATANLPKLKWLPKQLRVPGYDGPAKKVAKKAAKKAKR